MLPWARCSASEAEAVRKADGKCQPGQVFGLVLVRDAVHGKYPRERAAHQYRKEFSYQASLFAPHHSYSYLIIVYGPIRH